MSNIQKFCVKHSIELKLSNRAWRCSACCNERRRELYVAKKSNLERKAKALEWRRRLADKMRQWRVFYNAELKRAAFEAYGGARCAVCGEDKLDRLALDHVNNDGHAHRMLTRRSGVKLYSHLKTCKWPPGFQVLCHNCNILKRSVRYAARAETRKQRSTLARARWIKEQVASRYGGGKAACSFCGYNQLEALTLDHVNNDGCLTRGKLSPGRTAYLKLMRDGYPPGYQTLCFCCNMEKEILLRR